MVQTSSHGVPGGGVPDSGAPDNEVAALRARIGALRQGASLRRADPEALLQAAFTELDAALDVLMAAHAKAADARAAEGRKGDTSTSVHTERRLLHAVFQQAPAPLFLLGRDGTVRRANAAGGEILGSGPGYATGKQFTAFVDLPSRAALATHLAAALRTGGRQQFRCSLLTRTGRAEHTLTVQPVNLRGEAGQLIVLAEPGPRSRAAAPAAQDGGAPDGPAGTVAAITRRLDLMTAATRILLENITYSEQVAVQQYARLLATELDAWVIVDVERDQRLRRQTVTAPQTQQAQELVRSVAAMDPQPGSAPQQVYESGSALLVAHAEDTGTLGDGPDGTPLLLVLEATSLLCVPLTDGERSYGVLTLAAPAGRGHFAMADVGLVEELGEHLALAIRIDRLFRQRTEVADALQASLLPRQVRQIPGTRVAAAHVAATTDAEVGADFYDVYPAHDGWGFVIGDVCGRGEDAAAVSAAARHSIRAFAHQDADPAAVLRGTNQIMLAEDIGGRFVTAIVAHMRWRDGSLHLEVASAGHPPPLLVHRDGRIRTLDAGGLPLGIFPDAEPGVQQVTLEPGEVLFLFTDGLTSACGPDMVYFENRLSDELAVLAGKPPAALVSGVRELVMEFCQNTFRDDITMLAIEAGESEPGSPIRATATASRGARGR
jgi:serine phosphatase RsbU (regulator of sigma subunit)/PAS domain-containing protein